MSEFEVKIEVTQYGDTYLSITRDGSKWTSLLLCHPEEEIPQIIEAFERHLVSIERDQSIPVQPKTRGRSKLFKTERRTT